MKLQIIILCVISIIALLLGIVWLAYSVTAAHQQTITLSVPFDETYRFMANKKYKIDDIKIVVTGKIKKNKSTIVLSSAISRLVTETLIEPYRNSLLVLERDTFCADEYTLKRVPTTKVPSLENLSNIWFNKLSPLMRKIGGQLVSIKLAGENMKITHSRYKIGN